MSMYVVTIGNEGNASYWLNVFLCQDHIRQCAVQQVQKCHQSGFIGLPHKDAVINEVPMDVN